MTKRPEARKILETCLYAKDLSAAKSFYVEVMGLELLTEEPGRHVFLRCGDSMVLLFNPEATVLETSDASDSIDVPSHGAEGAGHVAFSVAEGSLPFWREHFGRQAVDVEREIEWPGGGYSIYVRDPANNSVEVASPALWGLPEA